MTTEFVILINSFSADEDMTDAERAQFEEILNDSEYRPDFNDGLEDPADWTVRATYPGEAEGSYYRKTDGTLQIMGYSISKPDGFSEIVDDAFNKLIEVPA
jgi:hypothetical protein